MKKIHVIPHEGFTVRDHEGNVIPADGAEVVDCKVVRSRIREGLLILVEDDEEEGDLDPAGASAPGDGGGQKEPAGSGEGGGDDPADETEDEGDGEEEDEDEDEDEAADGGSIEPADMSRKELMALLTEYGVTFKQNDTKEVLVDLVFKHLGEAE